MEKLSTNHTPTSAGSAHLDGWSDLLSGRHLAIVAVMASGVLLYAMNLYFTAALMPSIVASLFVSRILEWKGPGLAYVTAFVVFALGA